MAPDRWQTLLTLVIAAPFIGSFLGLLIRRLPAGRPVGLARSACEACGTPLTVIELVPIASYLRQRGRCRHCDARIAPMHLAIELAAVAVALLAGAVLADPIPLCLACGLGWVLLALAWIDVRHMLLPDVLTLPLTLAGLAATWTQQPQALTDHALAAASGYLAFRGISLAYRAARGREAIGQGDAKLLAAAGAWAGFAALPFIALGAAVATLGWCLVRLLRRDALRAQTALPFGPALALSLWVVWLSQQTDLRWLAAIRTVSFTA